MLKRSAPAARGGRGHLGIGLVLLALIAMSVAPMAPAAGQEATGVAPDDQWSSEYVNDVFPWAEAHDGQRQFKEYHTFESLRAVMQLLEAERPDIIQYNEGLVGGLTPDQTQSEKDDYRTWVHQIDIPWIKLTRDVEGGTYDEEIGDTGNYVDRPDMLIVGNHHAREWMSYSVPIFLLETIAYYDGMSQIDNDGDGRVDEDPADGVDNDGDCLSLALEYQDRNGDGTNCGPGDLGVDEDWSEDWLSSLVSSRELYIIPMLNPDGNKYDREVWVDDNCNGDAWESDCARSGWRKNLRPNRPTGPVPRPAGVDPGCDGVDINRNYPYEWGDITPGTIPLFPGDCIFGLGTGSGTVNNDVYSGPIDTGDQDGDFRINEDPVNGVNDDGDSLIDEDRDGGFSEPETQLVRDIVNWNDDNEDSLTEFTVGVSYHSYSELVIWPWGFTNEPTPDDETFIFHGQAMGDITGYTPTQSVNLYPTSGDFDDWLYGSHDIIAYTIEIGNNFHEHPDDIDHIATRNLGAALYMIEAADNPRERAQINGPVPIMQAIDVGKSMPDTGPVPVGVCVENVATGVRISTEPSSSFVQWRLRERTVGGTEFSRDLLVLSNWERTGIERGDPCVISIPDPADPENATIDINGTIYLAPLALEDDDVGVIEYRIKLQTVGSTSFYFPSDRGTYVEDLPFRAGFGVGLYAFLLFLFIAGIVWGALVMAIIAISNSGDGREDVDAEAVLGGGYDATAEVEAEGVANETDTGDPPDDVELVADAEVIGD